MSILTYLKEFQTLMAGAVGFAGVIVTLVHNARVAREQRAEEVRLAREQCEDERAHERSTLRVALLAELRINRDVTERNMRDEEQREEGKGAFVPTRSRDEVYRAFLSRIGLLSEDQVSKVIWAYLSIQSFVSRLYLIGVPPHTTNEYVRVPSENLQVLPGMHEQLLEVIDEAIAALEDRSATK